jgi:competence protein ComEC
MIISFNTKNIPRISIIAITAIAVLAAYFFAFRAVFVTPATRYTGTEEDLTFTASDYSIKRVSSRGLKYITVTAKLKRDGFDIGASVTVFDGTAEIRPGQEFTLTPTSVKVITPTHGIVLSISSAGLSDISNGAQGSIIYLPRHISRRLSEAADEIFAADTSAFLKSLIIGDREDWYADDGLSNTFSRVGLSHVVAISGMHLGFICGLIGIIFGANRMKSVFGIPVILLFMLVTGGSPSIVRAGLMAIIMYAGSFAGRKYSGARALVLALLIQYLLNPYALLSKSAILSYSAVAGIFLFQRKLLIKTDRKLLKSVFELISVSLAANIFTFPLSAILFGQVSIVFLLTNLLVLWAAAPAFVVGLFALGAGTVLPAVGKVIGFIPTLLARYILFAANLVSKIPFAAVRTDSAYVSAWLVYTIVAAITLLLAKEVRRRALIFSAAVIAALTVAITLSATRYPGAELIASALDIGQGQCLVFKSDNSAFVIDCGGNVSGSEGDIAADYLESLGMTEIDALILTHFHTDHANGAERLFERTRVNSLIIPALDDNELGELGASVLAAAELRGTTIEALERGDLMQVSIGDANLTIYPPLGGSGVNERGLIIYISCDGGFSALVTGDADSETELKFTEYGDTPDVDVLFVGHHGSKYSSSEIFLNAVKPEVSVISVGASNSYGHPTRDTLTRLALEGSDIYRTDLNGTLEIVAYGGE